MRPLTEAEIRASIVNGTDAELRSLTLPIDYLITEWERIDFLGWRDQKARRRGYIVTEQGGGAIGIVLRASESLMSHHRSAYCNLCHTLQPADQVSLFTARKVGPAGEHGDTVGTYICADLSCPENVRLGAPLAQNEVVPTGRAEARIRALITRTEGFILRVLG